MNFEETSNQYLLELKNSGIIITGDLIGVNETLETSIAKVIGVDKPKESRIIIYKLNNVLDWKYYDPIDNTELLIYSTNDWNYPQFILRIVAPIALLLQYPQFEVWFRINNLPIVNTDGILHCYCNEILPEHQTLVDSLHGIITIENKP